tara:strand:+ start:2379 stop:3176 length:798 start_codon:yes stop_codon:yes gene_type:complete
MSVSFFYFGFLKKNKSVRDLLGYNNTLKRLQAPFLFKFLKPEKGEKILDFGCGAGFFSSEIKKKGADTHAVDIIEKCICFEGNKEIHYKKIVGHNLDYPDNYFDKILVSEILMVIEDRETLFKILKKKLKQNGKLFCLNAIEYEDIKNLYNNNKLISFFKFFFPRLPDNYIKFLSDFLKMDNCKRKSLPSIKEIRKIFFVNKFKNIEEKFICNGIGFSVENYFRLLFFLSNFRFNYNNFFLFLLLYMLNIIKKKNKSHLLTIASK